VHIKDTRARDFEYWSRRSSVSRCSRVGMLDLGRQVKNGGMIKKWQYSHICCYLGSTIDHQVVYCSSVQSFHHVWEMGVASIVPTNQSRNPWETDDLAPRHNPIQLVHGTHLGRLLLDPVCIGEAERVCTVQRRVVLAASNTRSLKMCQARYPAKRAQREGKGATAPSVRTGSSRVLNGCES
jgi:hypothetical protein